MAKHVTLAAGLMYLAGWAGGLMAAEPTPAEARAALQKAIQFFAEEVAAGGGYVYAVSHDLKRREGEAAVGASTAWLEPPATPAVGQALLRVHELTGEPVALDAARAAGQALVLGQLQSGGWAERIEFDPAERVRYAYRKEPGVGKPPKKVKNFTTFDDDKSMAAVRLLMALDKHLDFQDPTIHEASEYALRAFVQAQYPNGAWPQQYEAFPDPAAHPVAQASIPATWSREWVKQDYRGYYTLNDGNISKLIETMLLAWDVYGEDRYLQAARRGGEFFLLAQLPAPQPGWAQQYDGAMRPTWARKFEPPAITGGESQKVMASLLLLYRRTADKKFLEPIPRALDYYERLLLPDGKLARFYELGTNRPLYFTKDYVLTYSDADLPTHYGFKVDAKLDRLRQDYAKLAATPADKLWKAPSPKKPELTAKLRAAADQIMGKLDDRGAWVERGKLKNYSDKEQTGKIITSETFIANITTLAEYVAAVGDR